MSRAGGRRFVAAAAVALAVLATASPAMRVGAVEQEEGFRVAENETQEREYPPLTGQKPVNAPEPLPPLDTPEECRTANWCDVIPLEVVVPPTLTDADEFFVVVELFWETQNIPSTPRTGTTAVNDMDLYVWDVAAGEEPPEEIAFSAGSTQPEMLKLFKPTKGRYEIVVVNFAGPNTGYRLKVTYKPEKIERPFESLEPDFAFPSEPVFEAPAALPDPPPDFSDAPEPILPNISAAPALPEAPVAAPAPVADLPFPLEPVVVEADPDFAGFADDRFDEALAAPPENDVLRQREVRSVGPARPPSSASLILWLAVVPLALTAGGGFWLARRGSAVLRFK